MKNNEIIDAFLQQSITGFDIVNNKQKPTLSNGHLTYERWQDKDKCVHVLKKGKEIIAVNGTFIICTKECQETFEKIADEITLYINPIRLVEAIEYNHFCKQLLFICNIERKLTWKP